MTGRRLFGVSLVAALLLWLPQGWTAPDQTMSITPTATSGATITASDENTRNNNISTPFNAHSHTDISTTSANTFNVGDGAAGNKQICANAADGTDMCLRWDDTANLWLVDNPAGTFNQIVTITGTAGLTAGTILMADGTSSIRSLTSAAGADDQTLVWDSATAATPRTVPNCTDTGGNHLNYTQSTNSFSCGTSSSTTTTVADVVLRTAGNVTTTSGTLVDFTGASITLTTGANPVLMGFAGACSHSDATATLSYNMLVDSSLQLGTEGIRVAQHATATEEMMCNFSTMTTDLTAGSHTFKLQWQTSAATATTYCNTAVACAFWVAEVTD